jgi:putative flavoprotein involved in K+ transport
MRTTTVVIGAGQAGLAMSRCLTDRSIDHVVLDRSQVANSWRTERWDSLRLLTPNWLTRLPGFSYRGDDPDGYMTAVEVVRFLDDYRTAIAAPVQTHTNVRQIVRDESGIRVLTDRGEIVANSVVIATGACSTPHIPAIAGQLPGHLLQLAPIHYRNPGEIDDDRVLVVGASASGAQLAEELARDGRDVTIAVGEHTRLPRTYRGMDIHWWMDQIGLLDVRYDEVQDIAKARRRPSGQLVGSPEQRVLGINELTAAGVQVMGRLVGIDGSRAQFSGSLANLCADADLKQGRLLDSIDEFATTTGLASELDPPDRPASTVLPTARDNTVDLADFGTVIWATGFTPHYPWLDPSLLDHRGAILHDGGVMSEPGMYVLGLPFGRRRKSSFIDGVGPDAHDISEHLAGFLDRFAASHH